MFWNIRGYLDESPSLAIANPPSACDPSFTALDIRHAVCFSTYHHSQQLFHQLFCPLQEFASYRLRASLATPKVVKLPHQEPRQAPLHPFHPAFFFDGSQSRSSQICHLFHTTQHPRWAAPSYRSPPQGSSQSSSRRRSTSSSTSTPTGVRRAKRSRPNSSSCRISTRYPITSPSPRSTSTRSPHWRRSTA